MDVNENIFSHHYAVKPSDTNTCQEPSFQTVAEYMQDTALRHVLYLNIGVEQLLEMNITWILTRIKIKMVRYPKPNETLAVQTWSPEVDRIYAHREFTVLNHKDEVLALASSLYNLLDLTTFKPLATKKVFDSFNRYYPQRNFPEIGSKIRLAGDFKTHHEVRVRIKEQDIDMNHHVNNVKYINWILDAVQDKLKGKKAEIVEINYLNSSTLGESLILQSSFANCENSVLEHRIFKEHNSVPVVVAKTHWKEF